MPNMVISIFNSLINYKSGMVFAIYNFEELSRKGLSVGYTATMHPELFSPEAKYRNVEFNGRVSPRQLSLG